MDYKGKQKSSHGVKRRGKPKGLSKRKDNTNLKGNGYYGNCRLERKPQARCGSNNQETQDSSRASSPEINYLDKNVVKEIHQAIIAETFDKIPESAHILNPSALDNALDVPKTSLFGYEVHPDLFVKAAVFTRELVRGHAFEAANKRTGYVCAITFLEQNGYVLESSDDEADWFTSQIAMDKLSLAEITDWLSKHSKKKD